MTKFYINCLVLIFFDSLFKLFAVVIVEVTFLLPKTLKKIGNAK